MDVITDVVINLLLHGVDIRTLGFLSEDRFKGQRFFAWAGKR